MTENSNCCSTAESMVLACSGASNVGQLTNEAAERLDRQGQARFFCAAGIGANIDGMVESVRGASRVLVLDSCPAECAKKCMDQAGLSGYMHLVITDLGIEKNHNLSLAEKNIDHVMSACRKKLVSST